MREQKQTLFKISQKPFQDTFHPKVIKNNYFALSIVILHKENVFF